MSSVSPHVLARTTDFSRAWTESLACSRRRNPTVTTEFVSICIACAESADGVSVGIQRTYAKGHCPKEGVDITHQHFTHNEPIAQISTAVFSISVVVPVLIVSQCPCLLLVF